MGRKASGSEGAGGGGGHVAGLAPGSSCRRPRRCSLAKSSHSSCGRGCHPGVGVGWWWTSRCATLAGGVATTPSRHSRHTMPSVPSTACPAQRPQRAPRSRTRTAPGACASRQSILAPGSRACGSRGKTHTLGWKKGGRAVWGAGSAAPAAHAPGMLRAPPPTKNCPSPLNATHQLSSSGQ